MSYSIAGIKKKLKKEKGRKTDYAFDSGVGAGAGVCPPSASFIAKPSMPLTQATVASGTLMFSGAGDVAMQVPTPRNPVLQHTAATFQSFSSKPKLAPLPFADLPFKVCFLANTNPSCKFKPICDIKQIRLYCLKQLMNISFT